jgi:ribosome-associated translation inhibitor RaiA
VPQCQENDTRIECQGRQPGEAAQINVNVELGEVESILRQIEQNTRRITESSVNMKTESHVNQAAAEADSQIEQKWNELKSREEEQQLTDIQDQAIDFLENKASSVLPSGSGCNEYIVNVGSISINPNLCFAASYVRDVAYWVLYGLIVIHALFAVRRLTPN